MQLNELETGFWGVKRQSVYKYITYLEKESLATMVDREKQAFLTENLLRKRIDGLETVLTEIQEENQRLEDELLRLKEELESWKARETVSDFPDTVHFGRNAMDRAAGRQLRLFIRKQNV